MEFVLSYIESFYDVADPLGEHFFREEMFDSYISAAKRAVELDQKSDFYIEYRDFKINGKPVLTR